MANIDVVGAAARVLESAQPDLKMALELMCGKHSNRAESNIELMLLGAFEVQAMLYVGLGGRPMYYVSPTSEPASHDNGYLIVTPQYQWNEYRIDFRIDVEVVKHPFFVECDGHDFHERTKEQAERDRSRDRKIQEAGIPILRFTGREIYRDPIGCANQIAQFIRGRID